MIDDELPPASPRAPEHEQIAAVPRISMQAFCETSELATVISDAAGDRRMDKAHVKVHMGGAPAAIEAYRTAPTPNLIVLEFGPDRSKLHADLDELAQFCDAGTKVVIVGRTNDIALYRELMARGISDYLVTPLNVLDFIRAVSGLYAGEGADPLGRVIAFVGAKGGVGSSTVAHNVGWSIARDLEVETVIVDMDLAYGTAGLDFNQDPPQGIADAVFAPDRIDANMIDRLLSKCSDHLSLLAASATLDRVYDFEDTAFDAIFDILRASVPCIIVDVPHVWTSWSKRVLTAADDVVVVASPDLANLRNAKSLLDNLRASRPNDHKPRLVMNNVGVLKRPEIELKDFAKAVETDAIGVIPFDAKLFGTATNNGQMIVEVDPANKTGEILSEIGRVVMGRAEVRKQKKTLLDPIMARILKRKAS
ncbi:MAG: AAA family ATPase [Rhodoblastus sp.]